MPPETAIVALMDARGVLYELRVRRSLQQCAQMAAVIVPSQKLNTRQTQQPARSW